MYGIDAHESATFSIFAERWYTDIDMEELKGIIAELKDKLPRLREYL